MDGSSANRLQLFSQKTPLAWFEFALVCLIVCFELNVIWGHFEILVYLFIYSFCIYMFFIRHNKGVEEKKRQK